MMLYLRLLFKVTIIMDKGSIVKTLSERLLAEDTSTDEKHG